MTQKSSSKIIFYRYNAEECFHSEDIDLQQCANYENDDHVSWINVLGITDKAVLEQAAALFDIHPLVIEDIANPNQRAKVETYDDLVFVVLRMFAVNNDVIEDQQVSFVLRDNLLLSFREEDFNIFTSSIGEKLIAGTGLLRKKGEDYLLYSLLDVIIDNYFHVLDFLNAQLETLDKEILARPDDRHIVQLQQVKTDILYLRRLLLPVRDPVNNLVRNEVDYFEEENKYYLRDLQDHVTRDIEELDFQRDQVNSLMDLYYSLQTHKMNNVMKTLTTVSFVLLPLTFIATIYGMNFKFMPRVNDPNGFWEILGGMGVVSLILLFIAVSRKWISTSDFIKRTK